jgi:formylglycine-generating enzyme required for sulfatase activity
MEPTVRDILCDLIRRYGRSLCEDPARCQGMLNDLLRGQHRREVYVLISALKAGIADDLLRSSGGVPPALLFGRLRQRLEHDLAMTGEAAHWAVETWELALQVMDAPASAEPEMVHIPAGRFLMGSPPDEPERIDSEGPQHWVDVPAFALGQYAVTFDEWDACVAAGGCRHTPDDEGWGHGRRPVINVSWDDAQAYCQWLSRQTGKTYRLPSEAEWEYACRAGTTTPFWWGDRIDPSLANYDGYYAYAKGPKGERRQQTLPVEGFQPNPFGLYQMHGNVWEWCQDRWHGSYAGAPTDGSAWEAGKAGEETPRVVRGGSWYGYPRGCRAAFRDRFSAGDRYADLGFRVCCGAPID